MENKYLELKKFTIPELKWESRDNFVSDLPNNKKGKCKFLLNFNNIIADYYLIISRI